MKKILKVTKEKSITDYHKGTYGEYFFRLAWFDVCEIGKSCYHIIDGKAADLWQLADVLGEVELDFSHKNVDFGRAKKFTSKVKKIIDTLA